MVKINDEGKVFIILIFKIFLFKEKYKKIYFKK